MQMTSLNFSKVMKIKQVTYKWVKLNSYCFLSAMAEAYS